MAERDAEMLGDAADELVAAEGAGLLSMNPHAVVEQRPELIRKGLQEEASFAAADVLREGAHHRRERLLRGHVRGEWGESSDVVEELSRRPSAVVGWMSRKHGEV